MLRGQAPVKEFYVNSPSIAEFSGKLQNAGHGYCCKERFLFDAYALSPRLRIGCRIRFGGPRSIALSHGWD